jgi:hypothetical protein
MKITRADLMAAAEDGIVTSEAAGRLWNFLAYRHAGAPGFRGTHVLYYLGGMIAISAMTLFMTLGWERLGGAGLFGISVAYSVLGLIATHYLLYGKQLEIPAGITATFVLALTPLAVYGLQEMLGWRPPHDWTYRDYHRYIDWNWLFMEFATLAVGAAMLWRYRLPFLAMPVAVTLWYMSMDLVPFLTGGNYWDWELRKVVSLCFGFATVALAFWIDLRSGRRKDYAFWLYLFGVMTFWGGLSLMRSDSELGKFMYCLVNLAMIAIGTVLVRRVFAVFGALGVAIYLGHLSHTVFRDSLLFPVALSAIGFGIVYAGILWGRHEAAVGAALRARLPAPLRGLLEAAQSG